MKKTLFTIFVDNTIDIITNSSSELFVLNGDTLNSVQQMVSSIHPDYLTEYHEVVALKDADDMLVETYLDWIENSYHNYWEETIGMSEKERIEYDIAKHTKEAEKYGMLPEAFFENWDERNDKYFYSRISEKGYDAVRHTLDPNGRIFLLLSLYDNPNWDKQEALMNIGSRYHLG